MFRQAVLLFLLFCLQASGLLCIFFQVVSRVRRSICSSSLVSRSSACVTRSCSRPQSSTRIRKVCTSAPVQLQHLLTAGHRRSGGPAGQQAGHIGRRCFTSLHSPYNRSWLCLRPVLMRASGRGTSGPRPFLSGQLQTGNGLPDGRGVFLLGQLADQILCLADWFLCSQPRSASCLR